MKMIPTAQIHVTDAELLRRENANRDYMMRLSNVNLLLNFLVESGRVNSQAMDAAHIHGGWEFPTCQLRGHFLGHWLSAAAMRWQATGDREMLAKAETIVDELALCQKDNGGEWVAPIPEKYLHWIAKGKAVWAPHYTIHKVFMGLLDLYEMAGVKKALDVAVRFADWFYCWTEGFTREEMDDILDVETGGMLEVWAQLYAITGEAKHRELMQRYERPRLFEPLLAGGDPLTNMHANTTIPEILGCVRAYEATGEERYRRIVEAYWKCAVTDRGQYATGGQTCGEIWTPKQQLGARLGGKNQEHCTVYNMIRLADALLRWTKDPLYADYIEQNLYNGVFAQTYWQGHFTHGAHSNHPDHGLLTYFLPLQAGAEKGWATETGDFYCCHGTMVQANATLARYLMYQDADDVYVCQYFDAEVKTEIASKSVTLRMKEDTLAGSFHMSSDSTGRQSIHKNAREYPHRPEFMMQKICVEPEDTAYFRLHLRVPQWCAGAPELCINGEALAIQMEDGYALIDREWKRGDEIQWKLPRGLNAISLPENPDMVAFRYGPILLAGLCGEERLLYVDDIRHPERMLTPDNEREWGNWLVGFRTVGQERGIRFVPLMEIGYEPYSVYFPIALKR